MDISLHHIIENDDYVSKLATALDTNKEVVKKQIFDLLITLCTYDQSGFNRAIEILEQYKKLKKERYRFKIVIGELENALKYEYKVTLLKFINCLIVSAGSVTSRNRIRNEYISLGILPIFNNLRKLANDVPDICLQLKVFDDQRECDESQSIQGMNDMNENSHLDIFYAIYRHVLETSNENHFLHILQGLSKIDSKDSLRDCIWSTLETIVQRTISIEDENDAERVLRSSTVQKISCPHCRSDINSARKFSIPFTSTSPISLPPPPPPMILQSAPKMPPPPPPPIPNSKARNLVNESSKVSPKAPDINVETTIKTLPQQETPVPRSKMKTINWNKIPPNKVIGQNNIWSIVANNHQNTPLNEINWEEMEGLFCQQITQSSPKPGKDAGNNSFELRTKKDNEISLLDGKRSLNVNIFLKQFRSSNDEIIRMIRDGEHDIIGIEKLRGLLKILPEFDELEILKNFMGEIHRLGHAEKFLLELLKLPNYKLRIECMLLIEEFTVNLSYLKPSINAMLYAGEDLMTSKALQEVFFLVIIAGNFLNSGGYAGNAAGVKMQSLQKLTDIRANKPGMNLIHFVALQAEKRNKNLLHLAEEMTNLEDASKTTIEQLKNEISALETRIIAIKKQVDLPTTENDIKMQMENFIKTAENELKMLQHGMKELETMRIQLAEFFCEDPEQFKLEECFKIFYHFCEKFKLAVKENEKRKMLEEQANMRRKQREEQLANKRRQFRQYETPTSTTLDNSFLMDPPSILYDIRFSPAMNRRRISPNINSTNEARDEIVSPSPDITPNGSLRRRRSKVLSEEDEGGLMDFLRNSGHDNTSRERKSLSDYGSLDRSWAKRKQRPDLLNVDFNLDRERPSSPIDARSMTQQENNIDQKPRISREWRMKIENWLHSNEQDDKLNDDYKRRMKRISNRRTLDNENESEKLDTLVEEKEKHHLSPKSPVAVQPSVKIDVCDTVVLSGNVKVQHFSNNGKQIVPPIEKNKEENEKGQIFTTRLNDSNITTYSSTFESIHDNNSSKQLHTNGTNNKIEIDSDNIETPPTVRRNINVLKMLKTNQKTEGNVDEKIIEPENLGDGQFNRFSSARRTRRYKRPVDLNHPTSMDEITIIKSSSTTNVDESLLCSSEKDILTPQTETGHNSHHSSNLFNRKNSIDKSLKITHREGVRIGSLKSSSPEQEEGIKRYSNSHIRTIATNKITSHELNDEGFEETQSLVSDTPSLTTSSCNDESNKLTTVKENLSNTLVKSSPIPSTLSNITKSSTISSKRPLIKASNQLQTLLTRNQQSLERSRSLRNTTSSYTAKNGSSLSPLTAAPRRVNSMKKVEKPQEVKTTAPNKLLVKRSNSRSSLIGSISSLNSAVSTNTVKRMPTKFTSSSVTSSTTTNSSASAIKKSVISISNNHTAPKTSVFSSTRIPASRSSSSGSSIGPKQSLPKALNTPSSSFSTSVVKTKENIINSRNNRSLTNPSARSSSFMRPTTASASKSK